MKKFMSKFAAIAAGFAATQADAAAPTYIAPVSDATVVSSAGHMVSPAPTREFSTAEDQDFIIQKIGSNGQLTQYHYSHASHASHRSHASHYSSRY